MIVCELFHTSKKTLRILFCQRYFTVVKKCSLKMVPQSLKPRAKLTNKIETDSELMEAHLTLKKS